MATINEDDYRYAFSRPALGESFLANHCSAVFGQGIMDNLPTGEEVVDLETGWESGLQWFVVPTGATKLELVFRGNPHRCDRVRFVA